MATAAPELMDLSPQVVAAVEEIIARGLRATGEKHDSPGTPNYQAIHGPNGLLHYPGVDQNVFHTIVGTLPGVLNAIPATPSMFENPTYQIITGVQDSTGSQPTAECDPGVVAGLLKGGMVTAPFGRRRYTTREMSLATIGRRNDPSDPMALGLVGSPIGSNPFGPPSDPSIGNDVLRNDVAAALFTRAITAHRDLSQLFWTGNYTAGTFPQFNGLENLVTTGYIDALDNTSLPSLDSDVKDFNYQSVDDAGTALVEALTYIYWTRRDLARRTGVEPVQFAWAMRPELFYEISAIWACAYLTYRCSLSTANGETLNISGAEQVRFRDEMRTGSYLLVDGVRIPVIQDDGITQLTNTTNGNVPNPCVASDIYLLPLSVIGGRSTLFMEYRDFRNPALSAALASGMMTARVASNGAWLDMARQTLPCFDWTMEIQPRVVLRTPWLAGRLQHVVSCSLQQPRNAFPSSPYHVDGGKTSVAGPSFWVQ